MTQQEVKALEKEFEDAIKEMAHWYGWPELKKLINEIEEKEYEADAERASERNYEGDGVFADNH
jgi:hypothetical protein